MAITSGVGIAEIKALAGLGAALVALLYIARAVYRLTLHPLARYPGPKLRAVSHLPTAIQSSRGREPHAVRAIHARYGPVVRVQPNQLSFTSAQAWKDIYGHHVYRTFTKQSYHRLKPGVQDILTADYEHHSRQRAAMNPAFSERALRGQEPTFMAYIDRLVSRMQESCDSGETIDMTKWFEYATFDIISDLAFSAPFDCLKKSDYHAWAQLLRNFFKATAWALNAKLFGPIAPILFMFAPIEDLKKGKDHVRMAGEKVQERLARGEDQNRPDFWTYVSRTDEGKGSYLTVPEMEVAAAIMLPAGTETVATTLCGILYYLTKTPEVLVKLRHEIDQAFTTEADINMTKTATLEYLTATIQEGLRLYTPFAGIPRRQTPPEGGVVCGEAVPGDVSVGVAVLAAFHSPANFARPMTFAPERWLPAKHRPEWAAGDQLDACQPFNVGPRNCLGQKLAMSEMRIMLAKIVYRFDFELADNAFDPERQKIFLIREKEPLRVRLQRRKNASVERLSRYY